MTVNHCWRAVLISCMQILARPRLHTDNAPLAALGDSQLPEGIEAQVPDDGLLDGTVTAQTVVMTCCLRRSIL